MHAANRLLSYRWLQDAIAKDPYSVATAVRTRRQRVTAAWELRSRACRLPLLRQRARGGCQDARRIRLPGGASGNSWIAPGAVRGGLRRQNSGRARTISPFVESKLKVLVRLHSSHNQKNTEALLGIAPRMLSVKSRQDTEGDLASNRNSLPCPNRRKGTEHNGFAHFPTTYGTLLSQTSSLLHDLLAALPGADSAARRRVAWNHN